MRLVNGSCFCTERGVRIYESGYTVVMHMILLDDCLKKLSVILGKRFCLLFRLNQASLFG